MHEEYLKRLEIFSLSSEMYEGNLIELFKIPNRFENINPDSVFKRDANTVTRSNWNSSRRNRCNRLALGSYFSNFVIDQWNRLSLSVVSSEY